MTFVITTQKEHSNLHFAIRRVQAQFHHPLLPPDIQWQFLRFLIRIHAMPFVGGQPLPRRL